MTNTGTLVRHIHGMDTGEVVGYEVAPDGRAWCQVQWLGSDTAETMPADELRAVTEKR